MLNVVPSVAAPHQQKNTAIVVGEVGDWIRGVAWTSKDEIKALYALVKAVPGLQVCFLHCNACASTRSLLCRCASAHALLSALWCTPYTQVVTLGTALLSNHTIDADYLQEEVLSFVALTASKLPLDVLREADSRASHTDEKGVVAALSDLERMCLEFEGSAKDWFRRLYATEPPEPAPKKEENYYYSFTAGGGLQREKPKPPSAQEVAEKRLKALRRAIETLDAVYKLPFFDLRPRVSAGVTLCVCKEVMCSHACAHGMCRVYCLSCHALTS